MRTGFLSILQSNSNVDINGDYDGGGSGSDEIFRVYHSNTPASRLLTVLRNSKTGINTDTPLALFHVLNTDTGGAAASGALAILESKSNAYLQLMGWDDSGFQNEIGILLGYNGLETYNSIIYKVTGTYAGSLLFNIAGTDIFAIGESDVGVRGKLWFTQTDKNEFIDSLADGFLDIAATTGIRLGNGDVTNYMQVSGAGDVLFKGTSGLAYANIYVRGNGSATNITIAGTYVKFAYFDTNGESNNCTPDQANNKITVTEPGEYLIICSIHCESTGAGGADEFGFEVRIGGNVKNNLHAHRQMAGGGVDVGSVNMSGIVNIADNEAIEIYCTNEDTTDDVLIEDCSLSVIQIGGDGGA